MHFLPQNKMCFFSREEHYKTKIEMVAQTIWKLVLAASYSLISGHLGQSRASHQIYFG